MRHLSIVLLLLGGLLAGRLHGSPGTPGPGTTAPLTEAEKEVRALERAWLDAYEYFDVAAMNAIVADDFAITFSDGSMQDKAQVVASISTPPRPDRPPVRFYTEDVRSRVYGETVVLTGRLVTQYERDGKTMRDLSRYTDTYVRRNGRWQVVASHLSNIPPPRAQDPEVSFNAGQGRSLHENSVLSVKNPTIVIDVDKALRSVGIINFVLKEAAWVERYLFVIADDSGQVNRLFIAQFESILPGLKGTYTFDVVTPTRIGDHDYETSAGFFNFAQTIAANPGAEADQTKKYLESQGLKVDDDYLVARFARVTSGDRKSELILFYLESLAATGYTRTDLAAGGSRETEAERVFKEFMRRALGSFEVNDG